MEGPGSGEPGPLRQVVLPLGHQGMEVACPGAMGLKLARFQAAALCRTLDRVDLFNSITQSRKYDHASLKTQPLSHVYPEKQAA